MIMRKGERSVRGVESMIMRKGKGASEVSESYFRYLGQTAVFDKEVISHYNPGFAFA